MTFFKTKTKKNKKQCHVHEKRKGKKKILKFYINHQYFFDQWGPKIENKIPDQA